MKRTIAFLLAAVLLFGLCACGHRSEESGTSEKPAQSNPIQSIIARPTPEPTPVPGRVYYVNRDASPAAEAAWKQLAEKYTELTGSEVKIETIPADGYTDALSAKMDSADAPTAFSTDENSIKLYKESCLNLAETELGTQLLSGELAVTDGEAIIAVPYTYDVIGVAVNKDLLEKNGHTIDEIKQFAYFKYICEDIRAKGTFPITSCEMSDETHHYTKYMLNMPMFFEFKEDGITEAPAYIHGTYFEEFRNIWDLYCDNGALMRWHLDNNKASESHDEFGYGKSVFAVMSGSEFYSYMNDYNVDTSKYTMIPLYSGVRGEEDYGLCYESFSYWSINKEACDRDIEATVDFFNWVVTDEEACRIITDAYGISPFAAMPEGSNPCLNSGNEYLRAGKLPTFAVYNFWPSADWEANMLDYLIKYTTGYEVWFVLTEQMRNTWTDQYASTHKYA